MELIRFLPPFQATLNLIATCLIIAAYLAIRREDRRAHRALMIAALVISTLFLISYFIYHQQVGYAPFQGQGIIRPIYFTLLTSHIITAALIVPLVLVTLSDGLRERLPQHRRIAHWTLPLWLYTSVTGIIVYLLGFHLYAA